MSKSPEEIVAQYKLEQAEKNKRKNKVVLISAIIFIVLFIVGSLTGNGTVSSNAPTFGESSSAEVETKDFDWIPTGFNGYTEDDNLAWRWGSSSETNCTYSSGSCWAVILVARDGCSRSLYGEVNIFDKNNIQISYTNDTLGNVQAMQKVKLTFDTLDESADSANISRFSCY